MTPRMPAKRKKRVIALLNAISDLHEGDLHAVLELDQFTPLEDFGPNDMFELAEDGQTIIHTPGWPPAPKSLKDRTRTGESLGRVMESHLHHILGFAQAALPTAGKRKQEKKQLSGREFVDE